MVERLQYDSVIVGGGLAALRAALEIAPTAKVAIVSKVHPLRSNSVAAQGGINAALYPEDNWQRHMEDTVMAGGFLNDQDAVEILTKEAKDAVLDLDKMGVLFNRENGKFSQRRFGAQKLPRTLYAKDKTGQTMLQTLHDQALKKGVHVYEELFVLRTVIEGQTCKGIIGLDILTGKYVVIEAKSVLLAAGGYARLWGVSSNNATNTGDAQAMLLREGLALQDMELVQFHPTGLYPSGILIGEAIRGAGATLINERGERFMTRYDDRGELASRDIVTKGVYKEIQSGRGIRQNPYVNLDATKIEKGLIEKKMPQIKRLVKDFAGVDIHTQPIPVRPTAHYSMGGIPTDKRTRVLDDKPIRGLYAAGECACLSVHGANRLGGNSLLETVVFGKIAGKEIVMFNFGARMGKITDEEIKQAILYVDRIKKRDGPEKMFNIRAELSDLMDKKVGVERDQRGLTDAKVKLKELKERWKNISLTDTGKIFNTELIEAIELKNSLDVAECIVACALDRKESRGAQQRSDYPGKKKEFLHHTLVYKAPGGLEISHKNVVMTNIRPK